MGGREVLPRAGEGASVPSAVEAGEGGGSRPWIGIAANAHSGRGRARDRVRRLAEALGRRGLEPRMAWTVAERRRLVAESGGDPSCRGLVAAGGDGTVAALLNERPSVPLTVLPTGTENLFARHFRLGRSPERLAEAIAAGRTARIDLGGVDGLRFGLMAGLGFDADVVSRHHAARARGGRLRTTSRTAYVEPVLRSSLGYRFPRLTLRVEGPDGAEELTGTTALIFNLPRYALGLPFAPMARPDDGLLDLVVFRDPGPFRALHYLWLVFRGLHLRREGIEHRRARRIEARADADVPVQLDGDPGGQLLADSERPWTAEVEAGAVEIIVPATYAEAGRDALARAGA